MKNPFEKKGKNAFSINPNQNVGICNLPQEVATQIFSLLSVKDLCSLARTCKDLNKKASDDNIWKSQYAQLKSGVPFSIVNKDYKKAYIEAKEASLPKRKNDAHIKLVLLGDEDSRKSTFLSEMTKLNTQSFSTKTFYGDFQIITFMINGKKIAANISDVPSKEQYQIMSSVLLKAAQGAFIVVNCENENVISSIRHWHNIIKDHGTKVVNIVLVAVYENKTNIYAKEIADISRELGIKETVYVNLDTKENLQMASEKMIIGVMNKLQETQETSQIEQKKESKCSIM
jgi:GTPase SAR1 family protein